MVRLTIVTCVLTLGWIATSNADITTLDACKDDYGQCLQRWKDDRLSFLKSEAGYLNLAGLFWLKEGRNTFGSAADNDLVFPAGAESFIGTFELHDGEVRLNVNPDLDVRHLNRRVQQVLMAGDTVKTPIVARQGRYAWSVINRDGKFAVRLRDFDSPVLLEFPPIEYFPANSAYRVSAILRPYDTPRVVQVGTVIEGLNYNPWSPGVVEFEVDGQTYDLEAYDAGDELFFVFGDRTTGRETYPAGRFLYAKKPGADGVLELDFNTAQSPPCAYNDFATCPIASPRNRIAARIAAGERYERTHH